MFQYHIHTYDIHGKLLRKFLEYIKQGLGTYKSLFSLEYEKQKQLLPHFYLKHPWECVNIYGSHIEFKNECKPKPQIYHDCFDYGMGSVYLDCQCYLSYY